MKKNKKRRVRWGRLVLLIILLIALVSGAYATYRWLTKDPYEKYTAYEKDTKIVGSMKHMTDNKVDEYYLSCYYPKFDIEVLDKAILNYQDTQLFTNLDASEKYYIMVDYESMKVADRFTSVTFHQKVVDGKDQVLAHKDTTYNYDEQQNKLMEISDVLRRDYLNLIREKAAASDMKQEISSSKDCQSFIVGASSIRVYFDNDVTKKVDIAYEADKSYIAIQDTKIPSLYQEKEVLQAAQPEVDKSKKLIAFTFDDGPHYANTELIMKEFEKYNGRATFFMLGQCVEQNPEVVKEVARRGFELGNHSWDHSDQLGSRNYPLTKQETIDEIYNTQDAIYRLTGYDPKYFRPPYGAVNELMLDVNQLGYGFWDVDSRDWESRDAEIIKNTVIKYTEAGNAVILLHDIHDFSMESIKKILPVLHELGYQFVTYSTLMEYEQDYLVNIANNYGVPAEVATGK